MTLNTENIRERLPMRLRAVLDMALGAVQSHFLLRWTLANMIGWSIGLYAGSTLAASLGNVSAISVLALLPGGALAGGIAGSLQVLALNLPSDQTPNILPENLTQRWILCSTLGGALGTVPVFFTAFALIGGAGIGFAVMGMGYGLAFGWVQTFALRYELPDMPWVWLPVNAVGGCLCGTFALGINPFNLPVCCSVGPVIFGLMTGLAWRTIINMELDDA